jgi:hypothetical protein
MTWLERYQNGEQLAVWSELNEQGEAVYSRKLRDDARAVAMETIRRVRLNLETIGAQVRPASKRRPEEVQALEKRLQGKLPLSLHAWWLQIGEVSHEEVSVLPLNARSLFRPPPPFFPPKGAWKTSIEAWRRTLRAEGNTPEQTEARMAAAVLEFEAQDEENERLAALPHDARLRHPVTPDDLATPGFRVRLPHPAADFPLENAEGEPLFLDWLRGRLCAPGLLPF